MTTGRRALLAVGLPGSALDRVSGPTAPLGVALDWRGWRDPAPGRPMLAGLGDGPVLLRDPALWRVLGPCVSALAGWDVSALLVIRHPGAFAASLDGGRSLNEAVLLWLRAMLEAENLTRKLHRVVLTHDALLSEGQGALDRARLGVPLAWRPGPAFPDAEPALPGVTSAYAEVWCRHAWAGLCTLAGSPGGRHAEAEATLDRVRAQFDDACRLFVDAPPARLALPGVTLCAADSSRVAPTVRALRHSAGLCAFDEVVLFTDAEVGGPGEGAPGRTVAVPPIRSREAYSSFMLEKLVDHVATPHVLVVQWDGFVVDPAAWDESFRRYDYIGPRWADFRDGMDVGNGGFSFRSRRLLQALRDPRLQPDPALLEDQQICRAWRPFLEREHGLRFAPSEVADRFAYERIWPGGPAFGFHGLFNAWRHLDDPALLAVAALLPPDVLRGREFGELAVLCFATDRADAFVALVRLWRLAVDDEAVAATIRVLLKDADAAERCLRAAGLR